MEIQCACGHVLDVTKQQIGATVSCPRCGEPIHVELNYSVGQSLTADAGEKVPRLAAYALILTGLFYCAGQPEVIGREPGWHESTEAIIWVGVMMCIPLAAATYLTDCVYQNATSKSYAQHARSYARAGGKDIYRLTPPAVTFALFAVFWGLRKYDVFAPAWNPWIFGVIAVPCALFVTWCVAWGVFNRRS